MFKTRGKAISTADGLPILRTSGIVSYNLSNSRGALQTQIQLENDIPRTAVVFVSGKKLKVSCTKFVFSFQTHADGGYEYAPRHEVPVPLDLTSSLSIKDMVEQYQTIKKQLCTN